METESVTITFESFNFKEVEAKILSILEKYPYTKRKKPYNLDELEKQTRIYIRSIEDGLTESVYSEKCKIMKEVQRISDELEFQYFGFIK